MQKSSPLTWELRKDSLGEKFSVLTIFYERQFLVMENEPSNSKEFLEQALAMSNDVVHRTLSGLSEGQWLLRPNSDCNPVNWQVGHLVLSEHQQMQRIATEAMPELPSDLARVYKKPAGKPDDLPACKSLGSLLSRGDLLTAMEEQRSATIRQLQKFSSEQLRQPSGIEYAPFVYSVFLMIAVHWTMHSGQWAVVRRQAGLPIVM